MHLQSLMYAEKARKYNAEAIQAAVQKEYEYSADCFEQSKSYEVLAFLEKLKMLKQGVPIRISSIDNLEAAISNFFTI